MESYIMISELNDFVFCPRSIYFHKLYRKYKQDMYHEKAQKEGKIAHENIDQKKYSTAKKWLQGIEIYSSKFKVCGKIDLFNQETGELIERKNKIIKVYDGYKYQLYAQYFCLQEMGYEVKKLSFYSLKDNKKHPLELPSYIEETKLSDVIYKFQHYRLDEPHHLNPNKCEKCIYRELCDLYQH